MMTYFDEKTKDSEEIPIEPSIDFCDHHLTIRKHISVDDDGLLPPMIYISEDQMEFCQKNSVLCKIAHQLPLFISHFDIALALGFTDDAIKKAMKFVRNNYHNRGFYIWATEFENVHNTWKFLEPKITIDSMIYEDSEHYYQLNKPPVAKNELYPNQNGCIKAMTTAVEAKFLYSGEISEKLQKLLLLTGKYPLLSIKDDYFWGVNYKGEGKNMLANIIMSIRSSLI